MQASIESQSEASYPACNSGRHCWQKPLPNRIFMVRALCRHEAPQNYRTIKRAITSSLELMGRNVVRSIDRDSRSAVMNIEPLAISDTFKIEAIENQDEPMYAAIQAPDDGEGDDQEELLSVELVDSFGVHTIARDWTMSERRIPLNGSIRIRRIKCSEERPACRRCTSTGRDCLGYEIGLESFRKGQTNGHRELRPQGNGLNRFGFIPRPLAAPTSGLSIMVRGDLFTSIYVLTFCQEAQAFECFRKQTFHFLPGYAGTTTWETITMQLSHTEPALMCAIVAVGFMHQARTTRSTDFIMPIYAPEHFQFAMKHYSRAMAHVQQHITLSRQRRSRYSVEVVLLACLMFICIEVLHGNTYLAIQHVKTGLRILYEHLHGPMPTDRNQRRYVLTHRAKGNRLTFHRIILTANPRSTLDLLSEVYVRMECVAAIMFGQEQPLLLPSVGEPSADDPFPIPKDFQTLDDARLHLDVLTSAMYCIRGQLLFFAEEELKASRDVSLLDSEQLKCFVSASSRLVNLSKRPQLREHLRAFARSLAAWSAALACIPNDSRHEDRQARLLLEIQFFELWFISSTWLDRTEQMGDRFNDNYTYVLNQIEEYLERAFQATDYLHAPRADGPMRTFALNYGVLIPLFGLALRCRDTRIRRRALLVPSRLHIQETLLDSDFLATVVGRIVDIEEEAARRMNGFSPDRLLTCEDVPEAARFMHASISTRDGQSGIVRFVGCHWAKPEDKELTLDEREFTLGEFGPQ
nr:hypothetical protein CFP56_22220 [Quercus suber]